MMPASRSRNASNRPRSVFGFGFLFARVTWGSRCLPMPGASRGSVLMGTAPGLCCGWSGRFIRVRLSCGRWCRRVGCCGVRCIACGRALAGRGRGRRRRGWWGLVVDDEGPGVGPRHCEVDGLATEAAGFAGADAVGDALACSVADGFGGERHGVSSARRRDRRRRSVPTPCSSRMCSRVAGCGCRCIGCSVGRRVRALGWWSCLLGPGL